MHLVGHEASRVRPGNAVNQGIQAAGTHQLDSVGQRPKARGGRAGLSMSSGKPLHQPSLMPKVGDVVQLGGNLLNMDEDLGPNPRTI